MTVALTVVPSDPPR